MDKIYSNIAAVQLNFDGVNPDVYMVDNTMFRGMTVSEARFFASPSGKTLLAPFGGATLVAEEQLGRLYADFVRTDKEVFVQGLSLRELYALINKTHPIDKEVNFTVSRVYCAPDSGSLPAAGEAVMMYVEWNTREEDNWLGSATRAVTVHVSSFEERVNLGTYIDGYIRQNGGRVRGVSCATANGAFYLSLRDSAGRTLELIPSARLEDNSGAGTPPVQAHPMLLDDFDAEFRESWIYNATSGAMTFDLTFYY